MSLPFHNNRKSYPAGGSTFRRHTTRFNLSSRHLLLLSIGCFFVGCYLLVGFPSQYFGGSSLSCGTVRHGYEDPCAAREDRKQGIRFDPDFPTEPPIYVVTASAKKSTQRADLTRLGQTLGHVPNLIWIVVEDAPERDPRIAATLAKAGVRAVSHLFVKTTEEAWGTTTKIHHRGILQRNLGVEELERYVRNLHFGHGIVYFADDDNSYDVDLFRFMRTGGNARKGRESNLAGGRIGSESTGGIQRVGVWAVGLVGGLEYEGAWCQNGVFQNFRVGWQPSRKFPLDMAAFAINTQAITDFARFRFDAEAKQGNLETDLLSTVVESRDELEVIPGACDDIYVWHTQTAKVNLSGEKNYKDRLPPAVLMP
eukprot:Clim_evm2s71 gene=Clim_evmTU2s71